ncbi:MAG: TAXI family TRAP transporter solute-binding subunit [Alphaproteobacteria bacterium]|nr:TAXI family TRAP transporter solute-binding subunit [Alphaproteobacteria bacterium]
MMKRLVFALVVCALVAGGAVAASKLRLSIATGGTGGVFFPYGGGLARVLSHKVPGMQVTAEVTGGSVDNIKLVGAGDADIGFSTIDSAVDGKKGVGAYADTGPQDIVAIAVLYDSFVHVVARADLKITDVSQLKGRRISVGSAGSSTEAIADRILAAARLSPTKDVKRENLSVAESAAALNDGKIDAFFWIGGLPTSAVTDLVTTGRLKTNFVPTAHLLPALNATYPGLYRRFTLPKGVYANAVADVPGLGVSNLLFVSRDMKDETVRKILAGIFDNLAEVQKIHPDARQLSLKGASAPTAIPFHPAAEAFYRARGAAK